MAQHCVTHEKTTEGMFSHDSMSCLYRFGPNSRFDRLLPAPIVTGVRRTTPKTRTATEDAQCPKTYATFRL
jgi:hypothetical protein